MFIPLATTYEPLRAQMAAGVLRSRGISAWVAGDVASSNDGTVASGGCALMVEEADVEEATRILEANPAALDVGMATVAPPRKPLTLESSVGNGIAQGAVWLPMLTLAMYAVFQFLAVLWSSWARVAGQFTILTQGFFGGLLYLTILGAVIGGFAGIATWLLSNYRRRGRVGFVFVAMVAILLALTGGLFVMH